MRAMKVMFLVAALGAVGCVQSGIEMDWEITIDGAAATCTDVNGSFVRVTSTNTTTAELFVDRLACAAYTGVTQKLTAGTYTVTMDLLDPNDAVLDTVAVSSVQVDDGGLTLIPLVTFAFVSQLPGGQITATWNILVGGNPGTCADVGAVDMEYTITDAQGGLLTATFPCDDLGGTTMNVDAGSYTVVLNLLDATGAVLDASPPQTAVVTEGGVADLGDFTFFF